MMSFEEAMKHAEHASTVDACSASGKALIALRKHILENTTMKEREFVAPELLGELGYEIVGYLYDCGAAKHLLHERRDHYFCMDSTGAHVVCEPLVRASDFNRVRNNALDEAARLVYTVDSLRDEEDTAGYVASIIRGKKTVVSKKEN